MGGLTGKVWRDVLTGYVVCHDALYGAHGAAGFGQAFGNCFRIDATVKNLHFAFHLSPALAEKGFDPNFGARPLRREIQFQVEDALSDEFLHGNFGAGDTVEVDAQDGEITVKPRVIIPSV